MEGEAVAEGAGGGLLDQDSWVGAVTVPGPFVDPWELRLVDPGPFEEAIGRAPPFGVCLAVVQDPPFGAVFVERDLTVAVVVEVPFGYASVVGSALGWLPWR